MIRCAAGSDGCRTVAGLTVREKGAGLALGLRKRSEVGYDLPALGFGQARPRWHTVAQVALAEEPLEFAVGGGTDTLSAQGGLFAAVSEGVGFVALRAVLVVNPCSGGNGRGLVGEGVGTVTILGRDVLPVRTGCGRKGQGGTEEEARHSGDATSHWAPPLWNHSPTWLSSNASPTRQTRARLVSVSPNPGEKLRRMPRGRFQPINGAM